MELKIETKRFGIKSVIIDDNDYSIIKDYVWHVQYDKGNFYARCFIKSDNGKFVIKKMHRMIMCLSDKPTPHIDHINGNGLDNRRNNLREATIAQNSQNVSKNRLNKSGYKGVSLYTVGPQAGKYVVRIKANGKAYFGGYFDNPVLAAKKHDELAIKHHGEFANLNFKTT